jgi:hypothetical protein
MTNAESVRGYYARNKQTVLFRKAVKRCRATGAIPTYQSMKQNKIPLTALLVAFADWAGGTGNMSQIRRQYAKLRRLRAELSLI